MQGPVFRTTMESVNPWLYFSACAFGLTDYVETWTKAHPGLARTTQDFPTATTALMEVCIQEESHPEVAKILIDNGAEVRRVAGRVLGSPLCAAIRQGHEEIARLLVERDRGPLTGLRSGLASPLYWAMSQKSDKAVSIVRMLLDHGASVKNDCNPFRDQTPLHLAAQSPNPDLIELVLERGAPIDSQSESENLTPLMVAVQNRIAENCRVLLLHGANVGLRNRKASPALSLAIDPKDVTIAHMLLDYHADINATKSLGGSALHLAASSSRGSKTFVKFLIDNKINGATALHVASLEGHTGMVQLLLANGADPNIADDCERKPLWTAVRIGHLKTVQLLLKVTKDINNQIYTGHTFLSTASDYGYKEIVQELLDAGADIQPEEPGPHCFFLDPGDRLPWYACDALLYAYDKQHEDIVRVPLVAGAQRDPSEFNAWLEIWDRGEEQELDAFEKWIWGRSKQGDMPEKKILEDRVIAKVYQLDREKQRQVAKEIGLPFEDDLLERGNSGDSDGDEAETEDSKPA